MSDETKPGCAEATLLMLVGFALNVLGIFMRAWIAADTWRWFVAPTFDVATLTIAQCCGLQLFWAASFKRITYLNDTRDNKVAKLAGVENTLREVIGGLAILAFIYYPMTWCIARLAYALIGGAQ